MIASLIKLVDLLCHNMFDDVILVIKSKKRTYMISPRVYEEEEPNNSAHLSVVKDDTNGSNS